MVRARRVSPHESERRARIMPWHGLWSGTDTPERSDAGAALRAAPPHRAHGLVSSFQESLRRDTARSRDGPPPDRLQEKRADARGAGPVGEGGDRTTKTGSRRPGPWAPRPGPRRCHPPRPDRAASASRCRSACPGTAPGRPGPAGSRWRSAPSPRRCRASCRTAL